MHKRKFEYDDPYTEEKAFKSDFGRGHTLDSDEEDEDANETQNVLNEDDIEGEEDGHAREDEEEQKFTPFNMKEELEEGHFDADGHYHWKKDKDVKDNWLDNIDWVKIKKDSNYKDKHNAAKGLADSSDDSGSESDDDKLALNREQFNPLEAYRSIFALMQPKETIKKTIKRISGSNVKLSTVERIRRKKAGIVDESAELVTKITELSNEVLTKTGNMDIYDETYEQIQTRIVKADAKKIEEASNLDMYADDFDTKEKEKLGPGETVASTSGTQTVKPEAEDDEQKQLMWEYKINNEDTEILGPYSTEQMQTFVVEERFKQDVYVRKCGIQDDRFYSSKRIDFELYL